MNTAVHVEGVKELVIRAADQPREQLLIHRRHADHEVLLGEQRVEPVGLDNVGRHGEPEHDVCKCRLLIRISLYLGYGQP